jgi:hypothetical protein
MTDVTDNESRRRFELEEEGETAFVTYVLDGEAMTLAHTIVPEAVEGRGVGSRLVRGALDSVRERGLKVVPQCSFVRGYIERHPEYRDLVAS